MNTAKDSQSLTLTWLDIFYIFLKPKVATVLKKYIFSFSLFGFLGFLAEAAASIVNIE